jgi:hypothetical protein
MKTIPFTMTLLGAAAMLGLGPEPASAQTGASLIPHPDWDCYSPEGIASPEAGELILELEVPLDLAAEVGMTQYGERHVAVGLEGSIKGQKLTGTVMAGALDYALTLANGTIEIEQIIVLQADDGSYILMRNAGTGPSDDDVRVVMDFEAPNASEHAWLNTGKYVARRDLDADARSLRLAIYDVTDVPVTSAGAITIEKPNGVPAQSWEYRIRDSDEMQGEVFIVENVTLGASQSVGASKRGNRNIIPITGGEVTGQINGKVLSGGADYQNLGNPAEIDARYLWQASDGEIIIIRNAGSFGTGGLVPTFEARVDGPYAYLNENLYLSSPPGMGRGGVSLTFYESTP